MRRDGGFGTFPANIGSRGVAYLVDEVQMWVKDLSEDTVLALC